MNGELLCGGFVPGLLSTQTMMRPWARSDLTETTYQYLFPPLKKNKVCLRHGTMIGMPECGKTEMANDIAHHCIWHYGEENVNIVFTNWIQDSLENMDDRPVQLLIVDDATKKANARKSGANADDAADYYEIRHIFEDAARTRTGVIILIYATQRFKLLDVVFRNAFYLWFRTSTIDPDDSDIIKKYIGQQAYADLEKISAQMYYHHDDAAKERCMIHLPFEHRTGYFYSEMRPRIIHMVGKQEARRPEIFTFDRQGMMEKLMQEERWRKAARAYRLSQNGLTQDQIAEDPQIDVSRQRVSVLIAQVRGEISNRSGGAYEKWLADQLSKDGYEVKHDGRRGCPDIVIKKDDQRTAVSCKVYDFDRPKEIPRSELGPEIDYAADPRHQCRVQLSVWNLWEMRRQTITWADASQVPEKIVLVPLTKK